jgi:hypothetical protein
MTTPARSRDQRSARIDDTSPRPSLYPPDGLRARSASAARGEGRRARSAVGLEVELEHPQSSHAILIALSSESASVFFEDERR